MIRIVWWVYSQQWLLFDVMDIEYHGYYEIDIWICYVFVWYWSTLILPIYSNDWFCCEEWIMYLKWMDDDRIEIYMYWYKCDKKWMDVINDICDWNEWLWIEIMYGFENHLWLWMWIYNLLIDNKLISIEWRYIEMDNHCKRNVDGFNNVSNELIGMK